MTIRLDDELSRKLEVAASKRAVSVDDFASAILMNYRDSAAADSAGWVQATRNRLGNVWQVEDFGAWQPQHG